MHYSIWTAIFWLANTINASQFTYPLPNGFPFPSQAALEVLFSEAGGNFTNAPLAPKFDDDSLTSWKLQAFHVLVEVAFFTQFIANITDKMPGYELTPEQEQYVLSSLNVIQAQEEMQEYNANDAVRHFNNGSHIFPCTYEFPVNDFESAIELAQTFTDLYIGLLANIQQRTARSLGTDSNSIIYVLAQALGQQGQQSGWYRSLLGKPPSAEPFLTTSTRELDFSWLQRFIVPGTCGNLDAIPLRTFARLDVKRVSASDKTVVFRVPGPVDATAQKVAFINGALVPTIVQFRVIHYIKCSNRIEVEIEADFPFQRNVMHGMTLATVVRSGGKFITPEDVTEATVYGPAVIELD